MVQAGLVLAVLATFTGAEAGNDLKALEGVWVIEDALLAGRDHKEDFAAMKLTITGDKFAIDFGVKSDAGTLKLDPSHTPHWIDIKTKADGPFLGRTLPGIYELKDCRLILCCNSEKSDRPAAFEAKEKTPIMLLTFKRDKK